MTSTDAQHAMLAAREDLKADIAVRSDAAARAARIIAASTPKVEDLDYVWTPAIADVIALAKFILDAEDPTDDGLSPEDQLEAERRYGT